MTPTRVQDAQYISLATFRKNGKEVPTPVWAALSDGALYVFSESKAGKVKRLKNSSKAKIAPCTAHGKITGEWQETQATITSDKAEIERAYGALKAKYGWKLSLLNLFSRIAGKYHKRAMIRVELPASALVGKEEQS